MQGLLGTSSASWNNGDLDLQIGNGSLVNTDDYALFLVGDGSVFEGTDNILGWSALNATTFRVTAIDSPAQGAADGPLHFVAMPYTGAIVVPEPSGLGLAAVATCASVAFWRRRRTSSAA